ncbi:hypothetical protein CALCODRAFT_558358 [Calocera cornea HHB12733]|uniref:Uncharacterized protein n=1 Tax=Calocera cornea HHB12733 TaxID=1353952 RepID=A0A165D2B0_9BASI|nr:hypothetical protein CALCODRAFT_558358 [Calocera cornea HHB12733]
MQLFRNTSRKTKEREHSFFGKIAALLTPPPSPPGSIDSTVRNFERPPHGRQGSDDSTRSKSSTVTFASKTKSPATTRSLSPKKSLASIHPIPARDMDFIAPHSPPAYTCAFKDCWSDYCPTHNPNGSRKVAQARRVASMKSLRRLHTASQATTAPSGPGTASTPSMASMTSRSSASTPPLPPSPPATARYERKKYECYAANCVAANCPKHGSALTRPVSAPPSPSSDSPSHILYFPLPPATIPTPMPTRPQAPTPDRMVDPRPSFSRAATSPDVVYPTRSLTSRPSTSSHASSRETRYHTPRASTSASTRTAYDPPRRSTSASSRSVHDTPRPSPSASAHTAYDPPRPSTSSSCRPTRDAADPTHPLKVIKRAKSFAPSLAPPPSGKTAKEVERALREHMRFVDSLATIPVAELPDSRRPRTPRRQRSSTFASEVKEIYPYALDVTRRKRSATLAQGMQAHPYATARPIAYAV